MSDNCKTISQKAWELIEMGRHAKGMRLSDLAVEVGTSTNTVCLDGKSPERIPQWRLWGYLKAVGLSEDIIVSTLYSEFVNNRMQ